MINHKINPRKFEKLYPNLCYQEDFKKSKVYTQAKYRKAKKQVLLPDYSVQELETNIELVDYEE